MLKLVVRRLLLIPPSLLIISFLSFGLVALIPGDPARVAAGEFATASQVHEFRHKLGLDQPFFTRYWHYLGHIIHGNLGTSLYQPVSIDSQIKTYLPNSLELVIVSLIVAAVIGVFLGTVSAYFQRRAPDWVVRSAITFLQAVPDFVMALLLVFLFYSVWRVAPAPIGRLGLTDLPPNHVTGFLLIDATIAGDWSTLASALAHMALPVLSLGLVVSALLAKVARASLLPALRSQQVEFARACGLPERQVIRYALLSARTPILTQAAIIFATLIGGSAIIETIFNWQGVGQWAITSMLHLDIPAIQGFILVAGAGTLLVYIALDLVIAVLDPRVSYEASR